VSGVPLRFALPVFNEGASARRTVEELVARASSFDVPFRIWVYDDGSTDGLGGLPESGVGDARIVLHRRPTNGGVGEFFRWCFGPPIADASDDDVLVVLEGDATSDLEILPALVSAVKSGADVAVASRYVPGGRITGFPSGKRLTSRVTNVVLRALYRAAIRDWTIFYRAYRVSALRRLAAASPRGLRTGGFTANAEILVGLARLRCQVAEVPHHYRYGEKSGASKLKVLPHVTELVRLIAAYPPLTP